MSACMGIGIAIVGGKPFAAADDYAAILAALVIALNGWKLLRPAMNELMDVAPSIEFAESIREIAERNEHVDRVEKCLIRKMGNEYQVDMHIEVDPQMTVQAAHSIAHQVKDAVRREIPTVRDVLVHIEPTRNLRQSPGR